MDAVAAVRQRFAALDPVIDERTRRLLVAAESSALGPGGISIVSQATGVSRQVIRQGLRELKEAPVAPAGRIRRVGGGRKRSKEKDPSLVADLERLVEPLDPGRSGIEPAVDLQERSQLVGRTKEAGAQDQLSGGCGTAARTRL